MLFTLLTRALFTLALLSACAQPLPARTLPVFASHEAWCAQLKGAHCKGEWPEGKPGSSALGAYRFVVIEAGAIENFGGGPSVSFELKTPRGFVYEPMGAIGSTGRNGVTTMDVEGITDHPKALDVRTHARTTSEQGIGDTRKATFFVDEGDFVAVVHVHLGSNTRDERGNAKGHFGDLTWKASILISRGTSLKDGEYRLR